MGFLSNILGNPAGVSTVVNAGVSALDKLFYTDEEKAQDGAKERAKARQMVVGWMEATKGQNVARRLIALIVTFIWAINYVLIMVLNAVAPWVNADIQVKMMESGASLHGSGKEISGAMMLVLAFYFAAPHMGAIVQGAMAKFSGKTTKPKKENDGG